jgi:hypothetical protein
VANLAVAVAVSRVRHYRPVVSAFGPAPFGLRTRPSDLPIPFDRGRQCHGANAGSVTRQTDAEGIRGPQ